MPREKVLKIESVMDEFNPDEAVSDLQVPKDAIIETVAEAVLNAGKPVTVIDDSGQIVGAVHASRVVKVLFGGRSQQLSEHSSEQSSGADS